MVLSIMSPLAFRMSPLDEIYDAMMTDATLSADAMTAEVHHARVPRLSVTADEFLVSIAAPGITAKDFVIEAIDGKMSVSGRTGHRVIQHSIALPKGANTDAATAESVDGIITVTIPKKAAVDATRIAVSDTVSGENHDESPTYKIRVVAAGLAAADIVLTADDGQLTVRGETARTGARLCRGYRLPRDADVELAYAAAIDGIITVTIPKKPAGEPKRIAVTTATPTAVPAPAAREADLEAIDREEAVSVP